MTAGFSRTVMLLLPITAIPVLLAGLASCSIIKFQQKVTPAEKGYYESPPPGIDVSEALASVIPSVKRVFNYTSYSTRVFGENSHITMKNLSEGTFPGSLSADIVTNETTSGTALLVFADGRHAALLTCAHVVNAPDTIIQWQPYSDINNNRYIQSIAVKTKQQLYVRDMPEGNKYEVLAASAKNDIALIGHTYPAPVAALPVCTLLFLHTAQLGWGDMLYLAGYPAGQLMINSGIVSRSPAVNDNIVTDAPFNEGMSGGIALALRRDNATFDLAGIARAVSASSTYLLKPEKEIHEYAYNPSLNYDGGIYVQQKKEINYGITYVIPAEQIRDFYLQNRKELVNKGFNLDHCFAAEKE